MNIDGEELIKNFKIVYNYANFNLLICFKKLFSKEGIIKNAASYIIIIIIIIHIIDLFNFFMKQFGILKKKIKDIIYAIKNIESIKKRKDKEQKKKDKIKKGKNEEKEIKLDDKIDNEIIQNKINKKGKRKKNKRRYNTIKKEITDINDNDDMFNNIRNSRTKKFNTNNLTGNYSKSENKGIIKKVNNTLEYINDEKNLLAYDLALQYDTRTYCQYYICLLRIKHTLIFSFYNNNDYNPRIIKFDLFFIGFSIYYTVNALFYDDNTMHNIYITEGSYSIEYQLSKLILSSIISKALNTLLNLLPLSNDDVIQFKQNINKKHVSERGAVLNHILKIKFIFYFILSFVFLLFFWYYLSMFGAVYTNTQFHLLKDTVVSFGFSLLYPFGLCLLPGLLRIPALSDPKKKRKFLYKLSKIIQMFV